MSQTPTDAPTPDATPPADLPADLPDDAAFLAGPDPVDLPDAPAASEPATTETPEAPENPETSDTPEPANDADTSTQPEPEPEAEPEPAEPQAEAQADATTEPEQKPAAEPAADPDKANPVKQIEKLTYQLANLEKQLNAGKLTPEQQQDAVNKVEAAKDELAELHEIVIPEGLDPEYDSLPLDVQRKVIENLDTVGKRLERIEQQRAAETQRAQQDEATATYYAAFDETFPELRGQGPELAEQLEARVAKLKLDETQAEGARTVLWPQLLEEAKAQAAAKAAAQPKPKAQAKPEADPPPASETQPASPAKAPSKAASPAIRDSSPKTAVDSNQGKPPLKPQAPVSNESIDDDLPTDDAFLRA